MNKRLSVILSLLLFFAFSNSLFSQDEDLIQFSGVVLDGDSLLPIPYTSIVIVNTRKGTSTDVNGIFSFVAQKGDTIRFTAVGFKDEQFVIPDSLTTKKYSLIQLLAGDTVLLRTHMVYPWPSKEQFKDAFMNTRIPEDDLDRANRNLAQSEMRDEMRDMPMAGGSANYKYEQINHNQQTYYNGQYPSWSILNPIAWARFIESWNRGDFKSKK